MAPPRRSYPTDAEILDAVRATGSITSAAGILNLPAQSLTKYVGRRDQESPGFRAQVHAAKLEHTPSVTPHLDPRAKIQWPSDDEIVKALDALAGDSSKAIESRVAAIYALRQGLGAKSFDLLVALTKKDDVREHALRVAARARAAPPGEDGEGDARALHFGKLRDPRCRVARRVTAARGKKGRVDVVRR
jgi:hypothetical protein